MKVFNWHFLAVAVFLLSGLFVNTQTVSAASSQWFQCKYAGGFEKTAFSAVKKGSKIGYPGGGELITVNTTDDVLDLISAWYDLDSNDIVCQAFSFDVDNCANDFGCPLGASCGSNSKCTTDASLFVCPNESGICKKNVSQECVCTKEFGDNINCKSVFCGADINYSCFNNKCQQAQAPKQYKPGPGPGSSEITECAIKNEMLPALPVSVSEAMSAWQGMYPQVQCIKSEKEFLKCKTSDDCAIGSFCYTDTFTGDKQCKLLASAEDGCKSDSDCQLDYSMGGGSDGKKSNYHCDTKTGVCLFHIAGDCGCPYGDSPAIKGYCNSPFCPILGKFGEAGSLGCNSKLNKCEKLSTVPEEFCKEHLNCWQGSGGVSVPKTKCCVSNACTGIITGCNDAYADQKICPPLFTFVEGVANKEGQWLKKPSCHTDCPVGVSTLACDTDVDCKGVKVNLKSGETVDATCVVFDDIDKTELTYSPELLNKCKEIGIGKMCHATEKASSSTAQTFIPLETLDASVLNPLSVESPQELIGQIIKTAMGLIGSIALVMFVYGGVLWMMAMGNSEKSKKGMQIIVWSALGVMVILASYVVVSFVFEAFK